MLDKRRVLITLLIDSILVLSTLLVVIGCSRETIPPTPRPLPATVSELIDIIAQEEDKNPPPTDAIIALSNFGPEAAPAISVITPLLQYSGDRGYSISIAAQALANMGPAAAPAIPAILEAMIPLKNGNSQEAQIALVSLIFALGRIGPEASSSIPTLAEYIYSESSGVRNGAAWSIAQITQQSWPNAELQIEYTEGLVEIMDWGAIEWDGDEPLLVITAREWWENEGSQQQWPEISTSAPWKVS